MTASPDPAVQVIADHEWHEGRPHTAHSRHAYYYDCEVCQGNVPAMVGLLRAAGYPLIHITAPDSPATIDDPADLIRRLGYTIVGPDEVSVPRADLRLFVDDSRPDSKDPGLRQSWMARRRRLRARLDPSTKETR